MKTYKVWVEVEEYDDETDEYVNMECPIGGLVTYKKFDDARYWQLEAGMATEGLLPEELEEYNKLRKERGEPEDLLHALDPGIDRFFS